ncbi:MAG: hypothetical protein ACI4NG_03300 [Candidatus Gallimonas sp.]
MIPNILCAAFDKSAFENAFRHKALETIEQIGRYACFGFMIFNVPFTYFGFWFQNALTVYLTMNGIFVTLYLSGWIVFRKNNAVLMAVWLSALPMVIFLFSGIIVLSVPLILASVLFGVGHIAISYQNSFAKKTRDAGFKT